MRKLKRNPIIINAARGGVVDEDALLRAMDEGLVRQTIIDTWESEPDINLELLQRAFIATPHIAGYSADGKANATRMVLEALSESGLISYNGHAERFSGYDIDLPEGTPSHSGLKYSPLEDSARLKANPECFEQQRGDYPLRRE
jgi:erythronate-4-phosphate dehydrogenase